MMPRLPFDAGHRYRSIALAARIENAGPHELVLLLYEELDATLGSLALADRTTGASDRLLDRARSIVAALLAGLDPARGGALANDLGAIYRAMLKELRRAREATVYEALQASVRCGPSNAKPMACAARAITRWN